MNKQDWTQKLRKQMADYEEPAIDGLWADIEKRLDAQQRKQQPSTVVPLRRWVAAAIVAGAMGGASVWMYKHYSAFSEQGKQAINRPVLTAKKTTIQPIKEPQSRLSSEYKKLEEMPAYRGNASHLYESFKTATTSNEISTEVEPVEEKPTVLAMSESHKEEKMTQTAKTTSTTSEAKAQNKDATYTKQRDDNYLLSAEADKAYAEFMKENDGSENKWSAAVFAGNAFTGNVAAQQTTNGVLMSTAMLNKFNAGDFSDSHSHHYAPTFLNNSEDKVNHKFPVSIGLAFNYHINDRWALETGVVYTWLVSDFSYRISSTSMNETQRLQYIGVPLKVNYIIWGNKRFAVYASTGTQMDVNIKAKVESGETTNTIDKDKLQWSVNAAAGVQYNIVPNALGVYIEPGVKYYFDNGSSVKNIFKDTPVNFNLQLGVRLNVK